MTNEEIVQEIQKGNNIQGYMGELYLNNKRFIYGIAKKYVSKKYDIDDLMQEAYFGLAEAAKKFDIEHGITFLTYAGFYIERYIRVYFYYHSSDCYRIPIWMVQLMGQYKKFCSDYRNQYDKEPSDQEIMDELDIDENKLMHIQRCIFESITPSLDSIVPGTDGMTVAETIADGYDLEADVIEQMEFKALWNEVDSLGTETSKVIKDRYIQDKTQDVIADELQVPKSKVISLERKAKEALRINKKVRQIAKYYDYNCGLAYNYKVGRFKSTMISSTEFLAMKHVECEESKKEMDDLFSNLICSISSTNHLAKCN